MGIQYRHFTKIRGEARFFRFVLLLFATSALIAQEGARYLIITHDNFYDCVQPLARWKHQKGMMAKVVRLSEIGATPSAIRNYVIQAYNNWEVKPEYLLLVGSPSLLPSYWNSVQHIYTDNYYGDVSGDYRAEIPYGRFPCKTLSQCSLMVYKTLCYEKTPTLIDSFWMIKGVGIVNEDGSSDDTIYWNNVRFACQLMSEAGFIQVDTFSRRRGHSSSNVINAVNEGRGIVLYRGTAGGNWKTPFNVNPGLTNNGQALPIIASITCQTMTLSPTESMVGEAWLKAGSVERPKGAVAFFGNTHSTNNVARIRGTCTRGLFRTLFANIGQLGKACLAAKESIYVRFANKKEYEGFNLLGDPELPVLTGIPQNLTVYYPQSVRVGNQDVTIYVERSGVRIPSALVCLWKEGEVYKYGYTNDNGEITLNINPRTVGEILLTVTAGNSLPREERIICLPASRPYLIYQDKILNDQPPRGNGNGVANPGEEIWAKIILKNIGESPASAVFATLRTDDPNCLIIDSLKSYGTIPPDAARENDGYYIFRLSPNIPDGYICLFRLDACDDQGQRWNFSLEVTVRAGKLAFVKYIIKDTPPGGNNNQVFEPGESGYLIYGIRNTGGDVMRNCQGLLRTNKFLAKVIDSLASFGNLLPGEERYNTLTPFSLTISPGLRGVRIWLRIVFWGSDGNYTFKDSSDTMFTIGPFSSSSPTGPDAYGYFVYDNTDVSSGRAPTYAWVEIKDIGSLVPGATNADDTIVPIPLPFSFQYYGRGYDTISCSSNGFIAFGQSTYRSGHNKPIPSPGAPSSSIFPFWDDLDTRQRQGLNGEVYQFYDVDNNRYIIEYYDCPHYGRQQRETFQLILHDPRFYPTPTGDGEIIFQYYALSDASSCTVGHQDRTKTIGIQYVYDGNYDRNASYLTAGRAIKITTSPPQLTNSPWVTLERLLIDDRAGGNGNGVLEPGESALLTCYLLNRGTAPVTNLVGHLQSRDDDLTVNDSLFTFGSVLPNQEVNNGNSPYRFTIAAAPRDTILSFLLYLTSGSGYTNSLFFSLGLFLSTGIQDEKKEIPNYPRKIIPTIITLGELNKILNGKEMIYDCQGRLVVRDRGPSGPGVYFLSRTYGPFKQEIRKICVVR